MKITLVTCFNADWHIARFPKPYIPLNLLCLAAALRERGHIAEIADQSLALASGKAQDGPQFHQQVAELIAETAPDVVGFTTMCNSYPQTLTLARHCKQVLPHVKIVLGGPQATAADQPTLMHFPWVDGIVRGEADTTFPDLIDHWATGQRTESELSGLSWRDHKGEFHRSDARPLLNLDQLPYPAYDLYPVKEGTFSLIPVEAGRGCPFDCAFCSTNLFFSRKYRTKTPARLAAELLHLHQTYGFKDFDLVHDMLTVDRKWMGDFCQTLINGQYGFTWGCSARVDCVTSDLLGKMATAGCVGIFFGIETGSERLQPIVKKRLHTSQVLPVLHHCSELGMNPTASFITGFPDETVEDALDTVEMALDVLQLSPATTVQLHLLAPLVGSPLYDKYRHCLSFDGHSSDISLFLLNEDEIDAVKQYPDVFSSFYYIPTPHLSRRLAKSLSAAIYTCAPLLLGLRKSGIPLQDVFTQWLTWQAASINAGSNQQDYYLYRFRADFVRYIREEIAPAFAGTAPQLLDMIEYDAVQYGIERGDIKDTLVFREFRFDIDSLNRLIRTRDESWGAIQEQPSGMLFVNLGGHPDLGFTYLEVPVRSRSIAPGDELEISDLTAQLLNQSKLLIHNKTQGRLLVVGHHMTVETLGKLGLTN